MKVKYLIPVAFSLVLVSCGDKEESKMTNDQSNKDKVAEVKIDQVVEIEEVKAVHIDKLIESKFQYDKDWERFKEAVINKDLQGIGAFASSDAIDAQIVIDLFEDQDFLAQLKAATYDDLTTNDTDLGVQLVFSATMAGSDEDGNVYESGVYLYFSQGELSLELDNVLAAG